MIADRRIYVTADRRRAVEEGDPEAAFLLVGVGGILLDAEAARYGILPGPQAGAPDPQTPAATGPPADKRVWPRGRGRAR